MRRFFAVGTAEHLVANKTGPILVPDCETKTTGNQPKGLELCALDSRLLSAAFGEWGASDFSLKRQDAFVDTCNCWHDTHERFVVKRDQDTGPYYP